MIFWLPKSKRATVKVAPTNVGMPDIFVGATFTVALFAQIIYIEFTKKPQNTEGSISS
jgi:hypothetical protein